MLYYIFSELYKNSVGMFIAESMKYGRHISRLSILVSTLKWQCFMYINVEINCWVLLLIA